MLYLPTYGICIFYIHLYRKYGIFSFCNFLHFSQLRHLYKSLRSLIVPVLLCLQGERADKRPLPSPIHQHRPLTCVQACSYVPMRTHVHKHANTHTCRHAHKSLYTREEFTHAHIGFVLSNDKDRFVLCPLSLPLTLT